MHLKQLRIVTVGLILMIIGLQACNDDTNCATFNTTEMQVSFINVNTGVERNLTFVSVTTFGPGTELLQDTLIANGIALPLSPATDSSTFLFTRPNRTVDTLTVGYNASTRLISPQCGTEAVINQLEVRFTTFDSVRISASELLTINDSNIQIVE